MPFSSMRRRFVTREEESWFEIDITIMGEKRRKDLERQFGSLATCENSLRIGFFSKLHAAVEAACREIGSNFEIGLTVTPFRKEGVLPKSQ